MQPSTEMPWGRFIRSLGLSFLALTLSGCEALRDLNRPFPHRDLRIEQVDAMRGRDLPPVFRFTTGDERAVLLVTFSTDLDFDEHQYTNRTPVRGQFGLCWNGAVDPARRLIAIRDYAPTGQAYLVNGTPRQRARPDGRFGYRFVLPVDSRARSQPSHLIAHDVRARDDDLCLRYSGGQYGTVTARIPYAMIADALARAGEPHAPLP